MKFELLDCTLRDGGYINDWMFGAWNVARIFTGLQKARIDTIEVGYLRDGETYIPGRTVYPNTKAIDDTFGRLKNASSIAVMIDYGDCEIACIDEKANTCVDRIRVTFRKHKLDEAIEFCSKLMEKGYDISLQPVSTTSYNAGELESLVRKVNILHPGSLSIVDSYGLAMERDIINIFNIFDRELLTDIAISYHAHNNLQMGFANSIDIIKQNSQRQLVFDASLYGMGKSAGNCNTELLAMYLNRECGKNYDIDTILDIIDKEIIGLCVKSNYSPRWGYSLRYFVSAMHRVHPNYIHYLLDNGFCTRDTSMIARKIEKEKKLVFDLGYIKCLSKIYIERTRETSDRAITEPIIVIFDLDGTLVDSEEGIIEAVSCTIQQYKLKALSNEELHAFAAYSPLKEAFKRFCGLDDKQAELCCEAYRRLYREKAIKKTTAYPGVKHLLQTLKKKHCKLGIATFKNEGNTRLLLQSLGLDQYFDCIVGADYKKKETKFEILARCLKDMHGDPKRAVYIGDTENDRRSSEKIGMRFIGVNYGFGFRNIPNYANSPQEILDYLNQ